MTDEEIEAVREKYYQALKPIFLPEDPTSNNIINYFASLLRVVGMEDKGWDPFAESRSTLEDLNSFFKIELPAEHFPDKNFTHWRVGLLMYSHIVEMDATYEVITNLLRFRLGKGYSPTPFFDFLDKSRKKRARKFGLTPSDKISVIKKLSSDANLKIGNLFDEFYNNHLRNAISHSDFILGENDFRCRNGAGAFGAFSIPLSEVNEILTKAKAFMSIFFGLENAARKVWGSAAGKAIPYDPVYKGLMEVLVDENGLMCGFKVHWPNKSDSKYRRTENGVEMLNCHLDARASTIDLFVGLYARNPGSFSPLVEEGSEPVYSNIEGTNAPAFWDTKTAE